MTLEASKLQVRRARAAGPSSLTLEYPLMDAQLTQKRYVVGTLAVMIIAAAAAFAIIWLIRTPILDFRL